MKKLFLLLITCTTLHTAFPQNIGIGTTTPNTNAALDIESPTKGLLIPRLTAAARNAITATKGLMVFDLSSNSFWFHTGTEWSELATTSNTWSLNGNLNVTSSQFLGTLTNNPLEIRLGEFKGGILDQINRNYVLGYQALNDPTTATGIVAIGQYALHSNRTVSDLVAIGDYAMYHTGLNLQSQTWNGTANTAIGSRALYGNTNGAENTAIGYRTMEGGFNDLSSTAVGALALSKGGGTENTAIGARAMSGSTASSRNIAVGINSLLTITTGFGNAALGAFSLQNMPSGNQNTALGFTTMRSFITGNFNTALGALAMENSISGTENTAVGYRTLASTDGGNNNAALGSNALENNQSGDNNTAIGAYAMARNTTSSLNTAVGHNAMFFNSTGAANVAVGAGALEDNTSGDFRVAIGYQANSTGGDFNNNIAIGYNTFCTASNQVRLGNSQITSIGGVVGWTTVSDARFKTNVQADVQGLSFINALRPVSYNLNTAEIEKRFGNSGAPAVSHKSNIQSMRFTGFNAQEVETLARQLGFEFSGIDAPKNDGDYYGLRYGDFVVPLVKAVQEQQSIIDNLQKQIDELKKLINK